MGPMAGMIYNVFIVVKSTLSLWYFNDNKSLLLKPFRNNSELCMILQNFFFPYSVKAVKTQKKEAYRGHAANNAASKQNNSCLYVKFILTYAVDIMNKGYFNTSGSSSTWFLVEFKFGKPLRDSCDIGFRVQFNAEFPRQIMNFAIEFSITWGRLKISRWPFHSSAIFEAYLINSLRFCEV